MIQDPNSVFWSEELLVSVGYTHGTGARAMIQKELYIETTSPLSGLESRRTRLRDCLSLVRPRPEHRPCGMICRWDVSRDIKRDDHRMLGRIRLLFWKLGSLDHHLNLKKIVVRVLTSET